MADGAVDGLSAPIRSLLVSGFLNENRLARVLGEIADIGAAHVADEKIVLVFESEGGSLPAILSFLECLTDDGPTRALVKRAEVKIYEAHSAAAFLAFWMGTYREMAAGTRVGFHLPLITLQFWEVDRDARHIDTRILERTRKYEELLAELMKRCGLSDAEWMPELYSSGWYYLTAEECVRRGLVHGLF